LIEIIHSNRVLFKNIVDLLPIMLVRKESDASIVKFVTLLFDISVVTERSERKFVTAALARLGTGILLADRRTAMSCVKRVAESFPFFIKSGLGFPFWPVPGFETFSWRVAMGGPLLILLSVHGPAGTAPVDPCGHSQETGAPNLQTGP
jgi:hypothetical protein